MDAPRRHGRAPWSVVAVHGGPGGCGEIAPVAARLGRRFGVLEPWCVAPSLDGQIAEIAAAFAAGPSDRAVLIGHSWGAWTTTLFAVRHPERVVGLVWIGAPPFDAAAAATILPTRLARLAAADRAEVAALTARLSAGPGDGDAAALARLGRLFARADAWDPRAAEDDGAPEDDGTVAVHPEVFRAVWPEAAARRASGELRRDLARLACPVVAFHGTHDPHPIAAIAELGAEIRAGLRLHRLDRCGHRPWSEPAVREPFFASLEAEVARLLGEADAA